MVNARLNRQRQGGAGRQLRHPPLRGVEVEIDGDAIHRLSAGLGDHGHGQAAVSSRSCGRLQGKIHAARRRLDDRRGSGLRLPSGPKVGGEQREVEQGDACVAVEIGAGIVADEPNALAKGVDQDREVHQRHVVVVIGVAFQQRSHGGRRIGPSGQGQGLPVLQRVAVLDPHVIGAWQNARQREDAAGIGGRRKAVGGRALAKNGQCDGQRHDPTWIGRRRPALQRHGSLQRGLLRGAGGHFGAGGARPGRVARANLVVVGAARGHGLIEAELPGCCAEAEAGVRRLDRALQGGRAWGEARREAAMHVIHGRQLAAAGRVGHHGGPGQRDAVTGAHSRQARRGDRRLHLGPFQQYNAPVAGYGHGNRAAADDRRRAAEGIHQAGAVGQVVGRGVEAGEGGGVRRVVTVERDQRGLAAVRTRKAVQLVGIVDDEAVLHVAILQRGIAPADARHLTRETGQVGRLGIAVIAVRSTAGVGPGERRAVVRIVLVLAAGEDAIVAEADLIAVVKRGRAGVGEGKEPPFLHALHRGRVAVVVALLEQEAHAVGVVRAGQVHHGFEGHRRVVFLDRAQARIELRRRDGADRAAGAARIAVVVLERRTARAAVA